MTSDYMQPDEYGRKAAKEILADFDKVRDETMAEMHRLYHVPGDKFKSDWDAAVKAQLAAGETKQERGARKRRQTAMVGGLILVVLVLILLVAWVALNYPLPTANL